MRGLLKKSLYMQLGRFDGPSLLKVSQELT